MNDNDEPRVAPRGGHGKLARAWASARNRNDATRWEGLLRACTGPGAPAPPAMVHDCLLNLDRAGECMDLAKNHPIDPLDPLAAPHAVARVIAAQVLDGDEASMRAFAALVASTLAAPVDASHDPAWTGLGNYPPFHFPACCLPPRQPGGYPPWVALFDATLPGRVPKDDDPHGILLVPPHEVAAEALRLARERPALLDGRLLDNLHLVSPDETLAYEHVKEKFLIAAPGTPFTVTGLRFPVGTMSGARGKPAPLLNVNGGMLAIYPGATCHRLLPAYVQGWVERPRVSFWVAEIGVPAREAIGHVSLQPCPLADPPAVVDRDVHGLHDETDRFLNRFSGGVVPACKACDGIVDATREEGDTCPHCRVPLEVYWRGARLFKVTLAGPGDVTWDDMWCHAGLLPVIDGSTVKLVEVDPAAACFGRFCSWLFEPFREAGFGPLAARIECPTVRAHHPWQPPRLVRDPATRASSPRGTIDIEPAFHVRDEHVRRTGSAGERVVAGEAEVAGIEATWTPRWRQARGSMS